jgi:hypothetical protein
MYTFLLNALEKSILTHINVCLWAKSISLIYEKYIILSVLESR